MRILSLKRLYKPEYFFQPGRILHRINYKLHPPENKMLKLQLSWGSSLLANPQQTIGRSLATFGLYDLALSEVIFRLVRPGDFVIDGGANVGYTSRLMLDCLQGQGNLISFEPLPELFDVLRKNVGGDPIADVRQVAISSTNGEAMLSLPESFAGNDGVASLEAVGGRQYKIRTVALDSIGISRKVRLLKLDVEGHELSVLKGAEGLLRDDRIEYIVYEGLPGSKDEVTDHLRSRGLHVFKLVKGFSGLMATTPDFKHNYSYEPDNLVATKDPEFEKQINSRKEWRILSWRKF